MLTLLKVRKALGPRQKACPQAKRGKPRLENEKSKELESNLNQFEDDEPTLLLTRCDENGVKMLCSWKKRGGARIVLSGSIFTADIESLLKISYNQMSSDQSWMSHRDNGRGGLSDEYKRGVDSFVKFAQRVKDSDENILCPCNECKNLLWRTEDELKMHLYRFGIIESYTRWYCHREKSDFHNHYSMGTNQNDEDDVHDAFEMLRDLGEEQNEIEDMEEEPNEEASQFYNMLNHASVPLSTNHEKHSRLSFFMKLLYFKNRHHCRQKGFDELLELIGSVLPDKHTLPKKYSEVKNMVSGLNMGYEKIDAYENDCMLFYKTRADKLKCDICGADIYKKMKDEKKKPIAKKILRDVVEGQLTHPADGDEWKQFDRAFPSFANESVGEALIELCNFFKDLCSAWLKKRDLEKMEKDIVKILCKLDLIFTPGFFDTMEHLLVDLATECKLGGPVQYRGMYPFERYLEAYTYPTSTIGAEKKKALTEKEFEIVTYYVLINMPEVAEYLKEFENLVYGKKPHLDPSIFEAYAKKKFIRWFEERVRTNKELDDKFKDMIRGPVPIVQSYRGCYCNGYKFPCADSNQITSPNLGICVLGTCYNEVCGNYYRKLEEVLKLTYCNGHHIMLFKCHWFDSTRNIKVDKQRMTTVNVKSQLNAEDVFVLASQAAQVYYAPNINNQSSQWYTVVTTKPPPLDETTSSLDDAFQEEVSNASTSQVEPIIIDDPSYFFIDCRICGNNNENLSENEEENATDKENEEENAAKNRNEEANVTNNENADSSTDEFSESDEDSS
ncbi:hypothetical protein AgCh_022944 [Apium graveolens]